MDKVADKVADKGGQEKGKRMLPDLSMLSAPIGGHHSSHYHGHHRGHHRDHNRGHNRGHRRGHRGDDQDGHRCPRPGAGSVRPYYSDYTLEHHKARKLLKTIQERVLRRRLQEDVYKAALEFLTVGNPDDATQRYGAHHLAKALPEGFRPQERAGEGSGYFLEDYLSKLWSLAHLFAP